MDGVSKFDELRIKTDKDLLRIFDHNLEIALGAASVALRLADDPASAIKCYCKAKAAHREVARLLPLAYGITEDERIGLQLRLNRVRSILNRLSRLDCGIDSSDKGVVDLALVSAG